MRSRMLEISPSSSARGQLVQRLVVQLGQHRAGRLAAEQPEERHLLGQRELAQRRRDVGGVGVLEDLAQALAAPRLQQIPDGVGEPGGLGHDDGLGGRDGALRRARGGTERRLRGGELRDLGLELADPGPEPPVTAPRR